jgi:phosphate starvation-inducible PhoH-like protein
VDLPVNQKSGLEKAIGILSDIEGIATVRLTNEDVVRHRLVKFIIKAFEQNRE